MTLRTTAGRRSAGAGAALLALLAPLAVASPAAASATASEVVYTADDDNDGIYSIVLRDLESRRLTTVLPADTTNGWVYDDAELSPDGELIAFATDRGNPADNDGTGLAVVRRDGSGFRRLTMPPAAANAVTFDVVPSWSPDGRTLLFSRLVLDNADNRLSSGLYTVPATATTATALTPVRGADDGFTADWSPDGRRIVFATLNNLTLGTGPITVVNADGSGRTTLGSANGLLPRWSPDGGLIAYTAVTQRESSPGRGDEVAQIATVPATGGAPNVFAVTRPTSARTLAEYPTWTPDGESIVFDLFGYDAAGLPAAGDLWAVDRRGLRAGRLLATRGDEVQPHVHGPAPTAVSTPRGTAGTRYTPVTPVRVLDTRTGTGEVPVRKVGPAGTVTLGLRGLQTAQGPVPADAAAVVLNVTVTGTTAATDVRVYPNDAGMPLASNLNAGAGQTVANLVTATLGGDGAVVLRNSGGSVHLIADLAGWYSPGTAGAGFAPLDPRRILETRTRGNVGAPARKVGPAQFVDLQVTGTLRDSDGGTVTVPADARAVVLNVTATGPSAGTDVRVYPTPADDAVPEVSNLNLRAGQTAANLVTVAVGQGGKVRVRNLAGQVDLLADLAGYYGPGAPGRFVPVVPTRFLDTRTGVGATPVTVGAAEFVDPRVAGTGGTPYRGVPDGATAVVLNLTGTGVTAGTDVRAFPFGAATVPTVSNLNLTARTTRANLTIVKTGAEGRLRIRNSGGTLNLIGDLAGYFVG